MDSTDSENFIELNKENICIKYPLFLANSFRKIISSDNEEIKIKNTINLIELSFHHVFNICISIYISLIKEERILEDLNVNKKVIEKIFKISFGDYLYLLPDLLFACNKEIKNLINISNYISNNSNTLNQIVNIRNDISHNRKIIDDKFISIEGKIIQNTLIQLLNNLNDFFFNFKIIIPLESYENNKIKCIDMTGYNYPNEIKIYSKISNKMEIDKPYLLNIENNSIYNLYPFFMYTNSNDEEVKKFYIISILNDKVYQLNTTQNEKILNKTIDKEIKEILLPLLPDYKYQKDPYLKGHDFLVLSEKMSSKIINIHGDVIQNVNIALKKIKYDSLNSNENDMYKYGAIYFTYPCPDKLFNLKAWSKDLPDLKIDFQDNMDTYRNFSIDFGKKIDFEEIFEFNISLFDPGWDFLNDNYYDNEYYQPTINSEVELIFPDVIGINSYELNYINKLNNHKSITSVTKVMDEFNNNVISYKVNKPLLDETLRLNIDFSIKDYENPKFYDKLRTSNLIYNLIMSSQFENYIIETSEDEIKIIPYIKSKE